MTGKWVINNNNNLESKLILTVVLSLIAKGLGFFRLQQIALMLGVSVYADVLIIILQVIWFIETVFVSSSAVPILISKIYRIDSEEGDKQAAIFFLHAALICSLISIAFAILINFFSISLGNVLAPGLNEDGVQLFSTLLLASIATPLALTISHFFSLVNRLLGNGIWYSIPQIIINTGAIFALIAGYHMGGEKTAATYMLISLGISALLVCIIQFFVMPKEPRKQLLMSFKGNLKNILFLPGKAKSYWKATTALVVAAFVNEIYIYVDFYFASQLDEGSISTLGYASRLATLVNMIVVTSAFVILEPRWANAVAISGKKAWKNILIKDVFTLISLLAAPIAILFFFPSIVTDIIYQSGNFSLENQTKINLLTMVFAFGVLALALSFITTRAIIIAGKQKWIFIISSIVLPLKILISMYLMPTYGVIGLAGATVLSFSAQAVGNFIVLYRERLSHNMQFKDIVKTLACYGAVFATAYALEAIIDNLETWLFIIISFMLFVINLMVGTLSGFGYATAFRRNHGGN